jgi:hypothetical protein
MSQCADVSPAAAAAGRHTSRFLMCWLTLLPFCVADSMGWATVPITCGMAFFLFGIEEIGVQVRQAGSAGRAHMHACMHAITVCLVFGAAPVLPCLCALPVLCSYCCYCCCCFVAPTQIEEPFGILALEVRQHNLHAALQEGSMQCSAFLHTHMRATGSLPRMCACHMNSSAFHSTAESAHASAHI